MFGYWTCPVMGRIRSRFGYTTRPALGLLRCFIKFKIIYYFFIKGVLKIETNVIKKRIMESGFINYKK